MASRDKSRAKYEKDDSDDDFTEGSDEDVSDDDAGGDTVRGRLPAQRA